MQEEREVSKGLCLLPKPLLNCQQAHMTQQLREQKWLQVLLRAVGELVPH